MVNFILVQCLKFSATTSTKSSKSNSTLSYIIFSLHQSLFNPSPSLSTCPYYLRLETSFRKSFHPVVFLHLDDLQLSSLHVRHVTDSRDIRGQNLRQNQTLPLGSKTKSAHSSFLCYSLQYYYSHFRITISNLTLSSVTLQPCIQPHRGLAFELIVKWQMILKNLCMVQLSPTVATSASTPAPQLLISRSTCGNIREKSLSSATNVASLAQNLVASRNTS